MFYHFNQGKAEGADSSNGRTEFPKGRFGAPLGNSFKNQTNAPKRKKSQPVFLGS